MNEINYLILNADRQIVDYGLELVYTLHHFIRGQQFNRLMIEPAPDNYNLAIAVNGATDTEAATTDYPVRQLKKIMLDDQTYYLTCYTLDPGSDTEVDTNVN